MPSCCQKRASSLSTTARKSQGEMRSSGTHCCTRRGASRLTRACLARASISAVVAGGSLRSGSAEGSERKNARTTNATQPIAMSTRRDHLILRRRARPIEAV